MITKFYRDLASDPELLRACEAVVNYLENQSLDNLQHITFASLGRVAGLSSAADAIPVAEYLSSSRINLLEKCFFLILDDDEIEIPIQDVCMANAANVLYHPETGEEIPDFEKSLYMYFTPSEEAKNIVGSAT